MREPKYRKRSERNSAFVEIGGKRHPLPGLYNSAESRAAYHEVLAKLRRGTLGPLDLVPMDHEKAIVAEVVARYLKQAEEKHDGSSRGDYKNNDNAARKLLAHSGTVPVVRFGPKRLRDFQAYLMTMRAEPPKHRDGSPARDPASMPFLSRNYINDLVGRVKGIFRWAVAEELVPPSTAHALDAVKGLKQGKTKARETPKRKAVPLKYVKPVLRHVPRVIRAMLRVQVLTGVRSRSICEMKPEQFDRTGDVWLWRPRHKTEKTGAELIIPIGPRCQRILAPWLDGCKPSDHAFSPRTVRADKRYRKHYDSQSYGNAIARGIRKANRTRGPNEQIPSWSPHLIRHQKGTVVNDEYGIEAAQAVLGHDSINATKVYRSTRLELAKKVARETG